MQGLTVSPREGGGTGTIRDRLKPTFLTNVRDPVCVFVVNGPVRGKKLACRDVFWKREETDAALFRPGPGAYPSPLCASKGAATCACHSSEWASEGVSSHLPTAC